MRHTNLTLLDQFWRSIDISENLQRTTAAIDEINNGLSSLLHAVFFALPATIGFGVLAWHFDLAASWTAMSALRESVMPTVEGVQALASYAFYVIAVLTYLPTILEMFGARFARFNVFWMQVVVIALCAFDLFTDLPRVSAFMGQHKAFFLEAGVILGHLSYWIVFALWWFLASYGFELLFVICAWSLIAFALKAMNGQTQQRRGIW